MEIEWRDIEKAIALVESWYSTETWPEPTPGCDPNLHAHAGCRHACKRMREELEKIWIEKRWAHQSRLQKLIWQARKDRQEKVRLQRLDVRLRNRHKKKKKR